MIFSKKSSRLTSLGGPFGGGVGGWVKNKNSIEFFTAFAQLGFTKGKKIEGPS